MHGLALNFASTHQTENPRGFSEVDENKQLLITIVASSFLFSYVIVQSNCHINSFSCHTLNNFFSVFLKGNSSCLVCYIVVN
ncbi:hypothetical protein B9C57_03070 [Tenacibaculum maritimum]|nr:hypothetical protein B9C57_03070 [Tenacibaculum maritimum]